MLSPGEPDRCSGSAYEGKSKLAVLMGTDFFNRIIGKIIIDFGCGEGSAGVEMAQKGAKRVIGIDIREDVLRPSYRIGPHPLFLESKTTFRWSQWVDATLSLNLPALKTKAKTAR